MLDSIFYGIAGTDERINLDIYKENVVIRPTVAEINLDNQQCYELGRLLIYIAGKDVDKDSADELISGYFN